MSKVYFIRVNFTEMRYVLFVFLLMYTTTLQAQWVYTCPDLAKINGKVKGFVLYTLDASGHRTGGYSVAYIELKDANPDMGLTDKYVETGVSHYGVDSEYISGATITQYRVDTLSYLRITEPGSSTGSIEEFADGLPAWTYTYNERGYSTGRERYEYGEDKRLKKVQYTDDTENKLDLIEHTYRKDTTIALRKSNTGEITEQENIVYDKHGNPVHIELIDHLKGISTIFDYVYTYDKRGNFTKIRVVQNGKHVRTVIRKIEYR